MPADDEGLPSRAQLLLHATLTPNEFSIVVSSYYFVCALKPEEGFKQGRSQENILEGGLPVGGSGGYDGMRYPQVAVGPGAGLPENYLKCFLKIYFQCKIEFIIILQSILYLIFNYQRKDYRLVIGPFCVKY